MNFGPLLFFGIFLSFALSWAGMIVLPQMQIGQQKQVTIAETGQLYPVSRAGMANQGKEVYQSLGCAACHTQQVRHEDVPTWGKRFTVAQDYLFEQPVLLGSQRVGPDLTNIGSQRDDNWHGLHLFNPKWVVPKSSMPAYPFLFRIQKIQGEGSAIALKIPAQFASKIPSGHEAVPTRDGEALIAYLQSLRSEVPILEASLVKSAQASTNAAPDAAAPDTNASATNATTNTAAPEKQ